MSNKKSTFKLEGYNKISNLENSSNYLRYLPDVTQPSNVIALGFIVIGFVLVLYIENYASRKKNIRPDREEY